jgi:hypothetical protein
LLRVFMFTKLLPGNALIKPVTVFKDYRQVVVLPFIGCFETSRHKNCVCAVHCLLFVILSYCRNFCIISIFNEFWNCETVWQMYMRTANFTSLMAGGGVVSCTKTFVTAYENTRCHKTESQNLSV